MPKINTYVDNVSIEDNDKLLTYDVGANATKLTLFSTIKDWMLARMAAVTSRTAGSSDDVLTVNNGTVGKSTMSSVAKNIVEDYSGTSLAGSSQSVKAAIDALDTAVDALDADMDTKASEADLNGLKGDLGETVRFTAQSLTEAQKAQARTNIGADASTFYHGMLVSDCHYTNIFDIADDGAYYFTTSDATNTITDLPNEFNTGGVVIKTGNSRFLFNSNQIFVRFDYATPGTWNKVNSIRNASNGGYVRTSPLFISAMGSVDGCYGAAGSTQITFVKDNYRQYKSYYMVFGPGTKIYFEENDINDCAYLSLCIGDKPISELIPVTDAQTTEYKITCTNGRRIRKNTSENTLPIGENNALDVSNKLVVFTYLVNDKDRYFYIKGISDYSLFLPIAFNKDGESEITPITQGGVHNLLKSKYKANYLEYVVENNVEKLYIWIPTESNLYIKYVFIHTINNNINANVWRIDRAYKTNRFFEDMNELTVGGEWECALRLEGRSDFSGGAAHGDEIMSGVSFIIDGRIISDITSYTEKTPFEKLTILQNSILYDPNDSQTQIALHTSEHIFQKDDKKQVIINQTIKWLQDCDIASCYLAMFPVSKNVSSKIYDNYAYNLSNITFGTYYNISEVHIFDDNFKYKFIFGVDKYVKDDFDRNGSFRIMDNGGLDYNKCYYTVSSGSSASDKAGEVTENTIWQTSTYYGISLSQ